MPATPPRDARGHRALARRWYTSRDVFDLEMERIFLGRWRYAGRSSDLDAPGRCLTCDVGSESAIVVRDADFGLHAFHNQCRHRGTRLCDAGVTDVGRAIRCPYHAWTYSLRGELIGAPNMADVAAFSRSEWPLHSVAVTEWEGCVMLNFAEAPAPFAEEFAPLLGKFGPWRLDELRPVHEIRYDVAANWKLVFQNYSECYHCPTLHPHLDRLTPYRGAANDLEEGPFLGGPMELTRSDGSMTMSGARCAPPLPGIADTRGDLVYYYTVLPNLLLSLHPDYVMIHRLEPQDVDRTGVVCQWLFHPDAAATPGFDPNDAIEFWNVTNLQDWEVCERSQRGVSSRRYVPGPYSNLESMIAAWDREYLRIMKGDGA
ncbi:MAG: aromatic ring-hydroxylating dioxygenase subunit alpha [bacterium]